METQPLSALNLTQQAQSRSTTDTHGEAPVTETGESAGNFGEQLNQQMQQVVEPVSSENINNNQQDSMGDPLPAEAVAGTAGGQLVTAELAVEVESVLLEEVQLDTQWVASSPQGIAVLGLTATDGRLAKGQKPRADLPPAGNPLPPQAMMAPGLSKAPESPAAQWAPGAELRTVLAEGQPVSRTLVNEVQPEMPQPARSQEAVTLAQSGLRTEVLLNKPLNAASSTAPVADMPQDAMSLSELISQSSRLQQVAATTAMSSAQFSVANLGQAVSAAAVGPDASSFSTLNPAGFSSAMPSSLASVIQAPVASQQWGQQLTEQVAMMVKAGQQLAEIRLNPAHLGPMEIKLAVQDDQASINFVASHAPVRDALDAAMPRLREMLEQQGLNLADVDVSAESSQQQAGEDTDTGTAGIAVDNGENPVEAVEESIVMEVDSGVNLYA